MINNWLNKLLKSPEAIAISIFFLFSLIFLFLHKFRFFSWRNPTCGSWFIQTLCNKLASNGKELDILTLLTFVNQNVAINYCKLQSFVHIFCSVCLIFLCLFFSSLASNTPDDILMDKKRQIPCIITTLTRILKFTDK